MQRSLGPFLLWWSVRSHSWLCTTFHILGQDERSQTEMSVIAVVCGMVAAKSE